MIHMQSKTATGRVGPLITAAAVVAGLFGAGTYMVQRPDSDTTTVAVTVRTHDEVVFWPNHSAVQRSAVATINNADGQRAVRAAIAQPDLLISIEASALGDPASIEIRATAASAELATEAAVFAGELAVAEAVAERTVPLRAEIESISQELPLVIAARDELLTQVVEAELTASERALVSNAAETAAGVATVLETDLARLEADVASLKSPLVLIDNPQEVELAGSAMKSSLASALGVFLVSLLGFSLFRQPKESSEAQTPDIDLTTVDIDVSEPARSVEPTPAAVE